MTAEAPRTREALPAVSLRLARPEDAQALALVGRATFLESYAGVLPVADILAHCERQHDSEIYAGWLADPRNRIWLAEAASGQAPVGYLVLADSNLPVRDPQPDDLEVKRIYLLTRFHGEGTGRRLMEESLRHAREVGSRRLLLGVYSRNAPALRFYARMGFVQAGERMFRVGSSDYYDYLLARAP